MFEIFALGITFERLLDCLEVPIGQENAPIRCGQGVVLPLSEVVVVVEPLVHLLRSGRLFSVSSAKHVGEWVTAQLHAT